ncbi:MAG: metallophosphoesterase, partial [Candidatus Latescibacteria bacterium]|nr:metallophosphoesterase [Candidatus Latescibacterota bacterium]
MKKIFVILLFVCAFTYARQIEAPIRFAIIGDRTGNAQPGIYEQVVSEIEALKPDFVLTVGDMIEGPASDTIEINERWQEYKSLISALSMPVYYTPGNNDIWDDVSHLFYIRYAGKPYYSFDIKGVHFISLDVSRYESSSEIPAEQLQWLINDLNKNKKARHTIIFYHKPFWFDEILENQPDTLHSIFVNHGVDAVFNGHFHKYFSEKIDDILYTAVGSSGGGAGIGLSGIQFHYTWVTIDKNGITITPLKKNSVITWDEVTAQQVKTVDKINLSGVNFNNSVRINQSMKVVDSLIYVKIANISDFVLDDTITWQNQDNWTVMPKTLPVTLPAKDNYETAFKVNNRGELYPAPVFNLNFPYAKDKEYKLEKHLPINRIALCNKAFNPVIDGKINEPFWKNPISKLYAPDG